MKNPHRTHPKENNFYQISQSPGFFDGAKYLELWEKHWGLSQVPPKEKQSAKDLILKLWGNYNLNRDDFDKYYMDESKTARAYLQSFLIPNIQRIYSLLTKSKIRKYTFSDFVEEKIGTKERPYVITDFGAGPLSASVAFLCALEKYCGKSKLEKIHIQIFAVERSEKIFQSGLKILESAVTTNLSVSISRITSIGKQETESDLIISANVFNEIDPKHHLSTSKQIFQKLKTNGVTLFLEPGQEIMSKTMVKNRDEILEAYQNEVQVIAPCPHQKTCPLGPTSERKDWCWFLNRWEPPLELKKIDTLTGLDHHVLNFFYVCFLKGGEPLESHGNRVVSDPIPMKRDEGIFKTLVCAESGELEEKLGDAEDSQWRRGDWV